MTPAVTSIDHIVLTVCDIPATVIFYETLGMAAEIFRPTDGTIRTALKFGNHKINLHQVGCEFKPNAKTPTPGSADFCLITAETLADWITHLQSHNIDVEEGPITRTGAIGKIESIYVRDPDHNLIEISRYI